MYAMRWILFLTYICMFPAGLRAFDLFSEDGKVDELLTELGIEQENDLELLRLSHLSVIHQWAGVLGVKEKDDGVSGWRRKGELVIPYKGRAAAPAFTLANIPADGEYRVWLRLRAGRNREFPVNLGLSGANEHSFPFGSIRLSSQPGKVQEQERPLRFEDEIQRISAPQDTVMLWEYRDVKLKAGTTKFSLTAAASQAEVHQLFITQSKSFSPSFSALEGAGTLNRIYYRIRLREGDNDFYRLTGVPVTIHWRWLPKGAVEPIWGGALNSTGLILPPQPLVAAKDKKPDIRTGEWTDWIDASWVGAASGPWATLWLGFAGVRNGVAEVQVAWYRHPAAVAKTVAPIIDQGRGVAMIPLHSAVVPPPAPVSEGSGAWGVLRDDFLRRLETAMDQHQRHFAWAQEARQKLGLPEDHPRPRLLKLDTGINIRGGKVTETVVALMEQLGLSVLLGPSKEILARHNLEKYYAFFHNDFGMTVDTHDPGDPAVPHIARRVFARRLEELEKNDPGARERLLYLKMGDEIGANVGAAHVRFSADSRARFRDYLAAVLRDKGETTAYFGVENLDELAPVAFTDHANPGVFQRRLKFHMAHYRFKATADYYHNGSQPLEEMAPGVISYANLSPHPPVLGSGQMMNRMDWFWTRHGGPSAAAGEDWTGGSWGFNGEEVVGYYAAWVECANRYKKVLPFFLNVGGRDMNTFSLIARRIFNIQMYNWGPLYAGAEASNFWSENPGAYLNVARACLALGPADELICHGRPEPARVALFYNRDHEIWNAATGSHMADRAITYAAVTHTHHPLELVIEDDLTDERLAPYSLLIMSGFNLRRESVPVLRRWVERGGTMIVCGLTGVRDEYDNRLSGFEELMGAAQTVASPPLGHVHALSIPKLDPVDIVSLNAGELTPELTMEAVGMKVVLNPAAAQVVGTYADGSAAAVLNRLGQGRVLSFGFQPGRMYKGRAPGSSNYMLERLPVFAKPVNAVLGRPRVEADHPQVEVMLFEHPKGIAVTLNSFTYRLGEDRPQTLTLNIRPGRKISTVRSSLNGTLEWQAEADRIKVTLPHPTNVDVLILE